MNPLFLLVLLALSEQRNPRRYSTPYFDTFRMELLLDKLQGTVNTLEKVNRLGQIIREPRALKSDSTRPALPAADSIPTAPDLSNALAQLAPLASQFSGLGDIKSLAQNLGPILNMFGNSQEN